MGVKKILKLSKIHVSKKIFWIELIGVALVFIGILLRADSIVAMRTTMDFKTQLIINLIGVFGTPSILYLPMLVIGKSKVKHGIAFGISGVLMSFLVIINVWTMSSYSYGYSYLLSSGVFITGAVLILISSIIFLIEFYKNYKITVENFKLQRAVQGNQQFTICTKCGAKIAGNMQFCTGCGQSK